MNEAKAHKNDIYSIISCAETELVRILPEGTERCKNCFALDLLSRSGFFNSVPWLFAWAGMIVHFVPFLT